MVLALLIHPAVQRLVAGVSRRSNGACGSLQAEGPDLFPHAGGRPEDPAATSASVIGVSVSPSLKEQHRQFTKSRAGPTRWPVAGLSNKEIRLPRRSLPACGCWREQSWSSQLSPQTWKNLLSA